MIHVHRGAVLGFLSGIFLEYGGRCFVGLDGAAGHQGGLQRAFSHRRTRRRPRSAGPSASALAADSVGKWERAAIDDDVTPSSRGVSCYHGVDGRPAFTSD